MLRPYECWWCTGGVLMKLMSSETLFGKVQAEGAFVRFRIEPAHEVLYDVLQHVFSLSLIKGFLTIRLTYARTPVPCLR